MALNLEDIAHLLATRGVNQYGREAVSQLEHALQCAQWAEKSGETSATVAAALLHDLGHLLAPGGDTAEQDDLHQYMAIPFLRGLLPDAVLEPIRLHVDAKCYLCTMEPGYWETLSPASQHSLVLQGGPRKGCIVAFAERLTRGSGYHSGWIWPPGGSGEARSFRDLITALFHALDRTPKIEYVDMPPSVRDQYQYFTQAEIENLRRAGYNADFTSLEEGVSRYVKSFLNQADRYR